MCHSLNKYQNRRTTDVETDDEYLYNNEHNATNDNTNNEQPELRRSSRVRGRLDRCGQSVYE